MPVEPLNLSLARSDAAQQVQNLFAQADRAGRVAAGEKGHAAAARDATSVTAPDAATEGSRIREEETGSSGAWEGSEHRPPGTEDQAQEPAAENAEGKGLKLDITA